jgi:hypothetical protein
MRRLRAILLFSILASFPQIVLAQAERDPGALQPGVPIERTITKGQTHSFTVNMEQDQFLQLVVEQRGIDVVVRVFSPAGKSLGEFDTPNGDQGPENVSLAALTPGVYRIDVTPLDEADSPRPGRYEIKILELRHATEQELQAGKNHDALKARGIALLLEVADTIGQIHVPQTRAGSQLHAAQLLWGLDDKRATSFANDAMESIKEYLSKVDTDDQDYYQTYRVGMQLRRQVVMTLAPHDPERALSFLRSTRTLVNPNAPRGTDQQDEDLQMELSLAEQMIAADPKRAFQIAEDTLKKGYSFSVIETIGRLQAADPELAARLAKDIATKLQAEKLLDNAEAANLALNLLRVAHAPPRNSQTPAAGAKIPLLSEQDYGDLFQKTLTDGLSYSAPATNYYSEERNSALNILGQLKSMSAEMAGYAPGSIAAVEKKANELNTPPDQQGAVWQKFQNKLNSSTIETAMETAEHAPREFRESLYQQVATKAATAGDFATAKQILLDHVSNPFQRRQALNYLESQAIYAAISRGKIDEALRSIGNLRSARERAAMVGQVVNQLGPGQKREAALNQLELARSIFGVSVQAQDQEHMNALLEIAKAFGRYDSKRGFEVIEPLLDQFNDLSAAAVILDGFGQRYYQDGELVMQDGNSVVNTANQLVFALASLAPGDFDRAKAGADRVHPPEVRIAAYLAIAQQAINGDVGVPTTYRRVIRN